MKPLSLLLALLLLVVWWKREEIAEALKPIYLIGMGLPTIASGIVMMVWSLHTPLGSFWDLMPVGYVLLGVLLVTLARPHGERLAIE